MTPGEAADWLVPRRGALSLGWMIGLLVWETIAPCFVQFRSTAHRLHHAVVNWAFAITNGILTALIFAVLWRASADGAAAAQFGLLNVAGLGPVQHCIASILLLDAWTYGWHRICHRVPLLWRFHQMHHSDAAMDVTTANRFHMVEILLSSVLRLAIVPLAGVRFEHLVIYETLLQVVVQWQHANVRIGRLGERLVSLVFVTPGLHKVHHSRYQPETDSNYSSLLSVWDRLFGSYRVRDDLEAIRFGLEGHDAPGDQNLGGLMKSPFRRDAED